MAVHCKINGNIAQIGSVFYQLSSVSMLKIVPSRHPFFRYLLPIYGLYLTSDIAEIAIAKSRSRAKMERLRAELEAAFAARYHRLPGSLCSGPHKADGCSPVGRRVVRPVSQKPSFLRARGREQIL